MRLVISNLIKRQEASKQHYLEKLAKEGDHEAYMIIYEQKNRQFIEQVALYIEPLPEPVVEYRKWLVGFLNRGGEPTYYVERDMETVYWYIALENFKMMERYGADAINVIVPAGIVVTGQSGHSGIYRMDGFTASGSVTVYGNTAQV